MSCFVLSQLRIQSTMLWKFVSWLPSHLNLRVLASQTANLSFCRGRKPNPHFPLDKAQAPVAWSHTHTHTEPTHLVVLCLPDLLASVHHFTSHEWTHWFLYSWPRPVSHCTSVWVCSSFFKSVSIAADHPMPPTLGDWQNCRWVCSIWYMQHSWFIKTDCGNYDHNDYSPTENL